MLGLMLSLVFMYDFSNDLAWFEIEEPLKALMFESVYLMSVALIYPLLEL